MSDYERHDDERSLQEIRDLLRVLIEVEVGRNESLGELTRKLDAVLCALEHVSRNTCELLNEMAKLAVDPASQGQGIGRRLVDASLAYARERGARRVVLLSASRLTAALHLYESYGFQHRPVPDDAPYVTTDVYMELTLT